ncbi:hypothetical protein Tco_0132817 [Tanacetum coccineum]
MKADEKKLEDILIVRNFPNVFHEDLTRSPLIRQTEFRIDHVPKATPVAKTPYRSTPSEKKGLLYSNTLTLSPSLKYSAMFFLLIISTDESLRSLFGS